MSAIESARIAFAGTPDFAAESLRALIDSGAEIVCVLTQPDRPAGRGRKLSPSPVRALAGRHGLAVQTPARLDAAAAAALPARRPRLLVVAAYGLILPRAVLEWPEVAAVNVHASLLPRWRGASPIQHAILSGDTETGVSIMQMTPGLDTGPVYAERRTPIAPAETAARLGDRLGRLGAELLLQVLPGILSGTLDPVPQDDGAASYAPKLAKHDAVLDWSRPAAELERRVRAFDPWPVAEARGRAGERLRIWQAEALGTGAAAAPGTVVAAAADGIDVATADGILRLTRVQPPGGRAMSARAYLAAHDPDGAVFGGG